MLELELNEAILTFVKSFRVARLRQLKKFFSDRGAGPYKYAIEQLLEDKYIHIHKDDIVSTAYPGKLPSPMYTYEPTLRCVDMMVDQLKSSEVQWFDVSNFPLNIMFLTTNGELYDVTCLDHQNWTQKYGLLPIAWKRGLPPGQADPVNHLAVVPDLDLAQEVRDLDFSQFILIDANGSTTIYDNDR